MVDFVRCMAGRGVGAVFAVRAYVVGGRAADIVSAGDSKRDTAALRLFVLGCGLGDLVGESGISMLCEEAVTPRVLIHERSSDVVVGVNGLEGAGWAVAKADGVDCFSGDPWGVDARIVEGDCPRGDSARRKGDIRPFLLSLRPKDRGAGLSGLGEADCSGQYRDQ